MIIGLDDKMQKILASWPINAHHEMVACWNDMPSTTTILDPKTHLTSIPPIFTSGSWPGVPVLVSGCSIVHLFTNLGYLTSNLYSPQGAGHGSQCQSVGASSSTPTRTLMSLPDFCITLFLEKEDIASINRCKVWEVKYAHFLTDAASLYEQIQTS